MNAVTMLQMQIAKCEEEVARLTAALHACRGHPDYQYTTGMDTTGGMALRLLKDGWEPNREHQCALGDESWRRRRTP